MTPVTVESDNVFATVNGTTLALDLYRPSRSDAPLVLYVHGGGWRAEGRLSVRGTSCPLTVTGTLVEDGPAGTVHVRGTAVLDRTAIGLRAPRLMIGRLVSITVDAWLTRP